MVFLWFSYGLNHQKTPLDHHPIKFWRPALGRLREWRSSFVAGPRPPTPGDHRCRSQTSNSGISRGVSWHIHIIYISCYLQITCIYIYTECYIYIYTLYIQVRETLSHHSSLAHHFLWLETSSVLQEGQGLLVGTWRKADQHQKKPWNSGDESDELNLNLFFGIPTPLKNGVKVSWDDEIPNIWKKHVPNHRSETVSIIRPSHLDDTYECCYSFLGKDDGKNKQVCQGSGISNKMPHIFQFKLRRMHWQSFWVWLKPIPWWTLIAGHWNVEHHKYRDSTYYIYWYIV